LGRWVSLQGEAAAWEGLAEAVDEEGALLLRQADGRLVRITVGDVLPI
jgi:biotin-(acetyl-CoA carboxylase) ligase